jgi:drug/metabolite transporter (DMT)-like permease
MRQPGPVVASAVIALLALIWGTTWAAIRISLEGFPPLTGVALRFAIASAVLVVVARVVGARLGGAGRGEWALRIAHGVLSFGVSYGVVFWAEQWVPSGLAAVIFATFSLFVVIMARAVLPDERMGPFGLVGVAVGLLGIAVIYAEDLGRLGGPQVAFASVVLLASPIASAAANVVIKRWGKDVHPVSLNAWAMGLGSVAVGGLALLVEADRQIVAAPGPVLALVYMAVLGSAVTFSLYFWLLQHLPASRLSLIAYLTPVVAVAIGVGFLDEPLTPRIVIGAVLVLAGVAAAVRR